MVNRKNKIATQEDNIRKKIVNVLKEAYDRRWITARDGNISVRMNNYLLITPTGVRKHEIKPEDIIKLEIKDNEIAQGLSPVSGEFEMHKVLQLTQPGCVIHLHPTNTVAAMERNWDLQLIAGHFQELSRLSKVGPNVPSLPVTSTILANETFKAMTSADESGLITIKYDIVGQKGHGATSYAKDLDVAFEHIERLEHACEIALRSSVSSYSIFL